MNVEFRASYGILLRFLNPDGSLDRLLSPIGTSISNSIYTIDQTIDQNDPDDDEDRTIERSMIIDEECDSIEDQLGLAFVASQTHITRVASMCRRIHDCCEHKTGSKRLLNIDGNKWEIRADKRRHRTCRRNTLSRSQRIVRVCELFQTSR